MAERAGGHSWMWAGILRAVLSPFAGETGWKPMGKEKG